MSKKILRSELYCPEIDSNLTTNLIKNVEDIGHKLLSQVPGGYIVFPWDNAPLEIKELCDWNGGDEDWVILTEKEKELWGCSWIEHTDSCYEPDIYYLDGFIIYIGSHA